MDPATERVLQILEEVARMPRETGPVALSSSYVEAVEKFEALPRNQTGADKTWVFTLLRRHRALLAGARRLR
jgi:hypothetical protein